MNIKKLILKCFRKVFGTYQLSAQNIVIKNEIIFNRYENRRFQLIEHILHDHESGISNEKYTNHDIIVSLTTYGKRINDVAFTIESIMQQTVKANRIILWLDNSFKEKQLPKCLENQRKRGLEVCFCDDIRSYTKLMPSLIQNPKDAIITIDDDLLYDCDLLERLIKAYLAEPQYIHACRVHRMILNDNGEPIPYNSWEWLCKEIGANRLNFLTGVGGVLYPPNSLDDEVKNQDVFLEICKYADDVWFTAMAIKKGTLINKVITRSDRSEDYIINEGVQDVGLRHINVQDSHLNDWQIKAVFSKYDLYSKLK